MKWSKSVVAISGIWVFGIVSVVAGGALDVGAKFIASGWIGDGGKGTAHVQLEGFHKADCHSKPYCTRVEYTPGEAGWAGICWQNAPDNWGDARGRNLEKAGYQRLTLSAKGEQGGEVVEFKAGGIDVAGKRYKDSFEVSSGDVELTDQWTQYTLTLAEKDLSSVIAGFCWVVRAPDTADAVTFYLDDIRYER